MQDGSCFRECRADHVTEAYRFFLSNCQCKLILLAVCHDNGYVAELDKFRNDATARGKTWLLDHYARGRAFTDPPFPMVKIDDLFITRELSAKRATGPGSHHASSSHSSALSSSAMTEQAKGPDQSSFRPIGPGLQHSSFAPSESRHGSSEYSTTPYLAPGVEPPSSRSQVPVVRLHQMSMQPFPNSLPVHPT